MTIQGEGAYAGTRAVFVRFAGCNVWSGREADRARDTRKGCCAAWCDTAFVGTDGAHGGRYTSRELAKLVRHLWGDYPSPVAVLTGGEPSLQLDAPLLRALHLADIDVHVETNGSRALPPGIDWVTLSPKPPMPVVAQHYDEVKVVYPAVEPEPYALASQLFIQPLDDGTHRPIEQAIDYVLEHPRWRLGLQTHKFIGLP